MKRDDLTAAVLALAARLGAPHTGAGRLWDGANVVLRLGDSLVARVATTTAAARGPAAPEAMERSIIVARHLAASGVRAPRPSDAIDPGPHRCAGTWITFWDHVDHDPQRAIDPREAAERLRALHAALATCPSAGFVRLGPLGELSPMLEALRRGGDTETGSVEALEKELSQCRREIDALRLSEHVIHGDASPGNLLHTPDGPVWSDFEDACVGPREWDLACLVGTARAFDLPSRDLREAILEAHGSPPPRVLAPFVRARVVQALVWDAAITRETGEGHAAARDRRARWRAWRESS